MSTGEDDFVFIVKKNVRGKSISDDQAVEGIQKFAKFKKYEYFSSREYEEFRRKQNHSFKTNFVSSETLTRRFGSWHDVLKKVGVSGGWKRASENPIVFFIHLEKLWRSCRRMPTQREFDEFLKKLDTGLSVSQFSRRYGNYLSGCARFKKFKEGKYTEEQLLEKVTKNKRKPISGRLRVKVLDRDKHSCVKCGASPKKDKVKLHVDHIKPVSKGGDSDIDNLQTLCDKCNLGKGDHF